MSGEIPLPGFTRRSVYCGPLEKNGEVPMKRTFLVAAASLLLVGFGATAPPAPSFSVDPLWPKPLPNHWLLGSVTGVAVDAQDHIWIVHRGGDSLNARTEMSAATNPKTAEDCCIPAPPVLEFSSDGTLLNHWGGPGNGYDWPVSPGGLTVDKSGNVWITAAGPPDIPGSTQTSGRGGGRASAAPPKPEDAQVLEFSPTGSFLRQIGKAGAPGGSDSTTALHRPAAVDVNGGDVYVADGFVNHRVAVFDARTGAFKRSWGGSGEKPDDAQQPAYDPGGTPGKQFRTVGCVRVANDGKIYVCDRGNDRVQVFDKSGKYLAQGFVSKSTRGTGSVWDIALSRDPQQQFLYVADGHDEKVFILRRDTLETVGSFGDGGRYPGTFYAVGSVAVDSKGNLYTGETLEGKRVQKFVLKGVGR